MSEAFDFENHYKTLSDRQILEILRDNPDKYDPSALEAARKEFDLRNLDTDTIEDLQNQIIRENTRASNKSFWSRAANYREEEPVEGKGDLLPVIIDKRLTVDNNLTILFWFWIGYLVFSFAIQPAYLFYILEYAVQNSLLFLMTILPKAILIAGLLFFPKRKQIAWVFLILYCVFVLPTSILQDFSDTKLFLGNLVRGLDTIWSTLKILESLGGIALTSYTIYLLFKPDAIKAFKISASAVKVVTIWAIFLSLIGVYLYLNPY